MLPGGSCYPFPPYDPARSPELPAGQPKSMEVAHGPVQLGPAPGHRPAGALHQPDRRVAAPYGAGVRIATAVTLGRTEPRYVTLGNAFSGEEQTLTDVVGLPWRTPRSAETAAAVPCGDSGVVSPIIDPEPAWLAGSGPSGACFIGHACPILGMPDQDRLGVQRVLKIHNGFEANPHSVPRYLKF